MNIKIKIILIFSLLFSLMLKNSFCKSTETKLLKYDFSFSGITGYIDKNSAQRGLQVYIEVCASCHGMNQLAYRNLVDLGYSKSQVQNIAAQFELDDIPDEYGEISKRNAIISDKFVDPFPNMNAAKAANNGAYPPDLSLIIKARPDGSNYLRSLLLGYEDAPDGFDVGNGYYNKYMASNIIAMPQPLYGEDVEYQDGTKATMEQEIIDVVTFLTWAAMPELENRRSAGIKSIIFLFIMTILFYLSYRKIWSNIEKS